MPNQTSISKTYPGTDQTGPVGDREVIHLVTTDALDRDREVVIPSGIDLSDFRKNPVVTFQHSDQDPDCKLLPVATAKWIKLSSDGHGLIARTEFDTDEFALRVGGQAKRGVLRMWSLRFQPTEFGPPTKDELLRRPDWKSAKTIYRKSKLLSYSIVIIPANPECATLVKMAKTTHGGSMAETVVDEGVATAPDAAEIETSLEVVVADPPIPVTKAMDMGETGLAEGGAAVPDEQKDDEGEDDSVSDSLPPIARGDHVRCMKGMHKGCVGKVMSLHKGEMVPDVVDDCYGTHEMPAARVRCYKAMGDGHLPTDHHVGVGCECLEKMPDEMKSPSKKKSVDGEGTKARVAATPVALKFHTPADLAAAKRTYLKSPEFAAKVESSIKTSLARAKGIV